MAGRKEDLTTVELANGRAPIVAPHLLLTCRLTRRHELLRRSKNNETFYRDMDDGRSIGRPADRAGHWRSADCATVNADNHIVTAECRH